MLLRRVAKFCAITFKHWTLGCGRLVEDSHGSFMPQEPYLPYMHRICACLVDAHVIQFQARSETFSYGSMGAGRVS